MIDWAAGCAYGVREWVEAVQGSAFAAFAAEPFPEVDVALLLEPLEGAVIEPPPLAAARTQAAVATAPLAVQCIVSRETHFDAGDSTALHRNFSFLLQQTLQRLMLQRDASADGRWMCPSSPPAEQSAGATRQEPSTSATAARQSGEIPHVSNSVHRSTSESLIERIEQWIEQAPGLAPAAVPQHHWRARGKDSHFTGQHLSDDTRVSHARRHVDGPARRSRDVSPEEVRAALPGRVDGQVRGEPPATTLQQLVRAALPGRVDGQVRGEPPATTLQQLASAAWNGLPKPAPVARGGVAPQAESVTQALGRLVETIATLETRIAAKQAEAPPGQPSSPGVRWLDDDDLAGRLHNILKRQARRRGIDLS